MKTSPILTQLKAWLVNRGAKPKLAAGVALLAMGVISCTTVTRTVMMPPTIPGAKYVGSQKCAQCHEEICRDFKTATHARITAPGTNSLHIGCEACHGPGSLHIDSGGETRPPGNFRPGDVQPIVTAPRGAIVNPGRSADACFNCHPAARGQFSLPSHHPVIEGKVTCLDCHPVHKGPAINTGRTSLLSENAGCIRCHEAQRGPYVFEHEAMREGCTTCHEAHGSVNAKMLSARNASLCLKCHFQQVRGGAINIGAVNHSGFLQQGTCWTAGCHEAVHGSRVNPSLRY